MDTAANRTLLKAALARLEQRRHIELILQRWQDDDWAAHPALFNLREHTKAYIDRLRGEAI
jgi:hypothetical protein